MSMKMGQIEVMEGRGNPGWAFYLWDSKHGTRLLRAEYGFATPQAAARAAMKCKDDLKEAKRILKGKSK